MVWAAELLFDVVVEVLLEGPAWFFICVTSPGLEKRWWSWETEGFLLMACGLYYVENRIFASKVLISSVLGLRMLELPVMVFMN